MANKRYLFLTGTGLVIASAVIIATPISIAKTSQRSAKERADEQLKHIAGVNLKVTEDTLFKKYDELKQLFNERKSQSNSKKDSLTNLFTPIYNDLYVDSINSDYKFKVDSVLNKDSIKDNEVNSFVKLSSNSQSFVVNYYIEDPQGVKSNVKSFEINSFSPNDWVQKVANEIDIKPYVYASRDKLTEEERNKVIYPQSLYSFQFAKEANQPWIRSDTMRLLLDKYAKIGFSNSNDEAIFKQNFEKWEFVKNDSGNWVDVTEDQNSVIVSIELTSKEGNKTKVRRILNGPNWFRSLSQDISEIKLSNTSLYVAPESNFINKTAQEALEYLFTQTGAKNYGLDNIVGTLFELENVETVTKGTKTTISWELDIKNSYVENDELNLKLLVIASNPVASNSIISTKYITISGFKKIFDVDLRNYYSSKIFNSLTGFTQATQTGLHQYKVVDWAKNSRSRVQPVIKYNDFKKLIEDSDNNKKPSANAKNKNVALTPKELDAFLNNFYEFHPLQKLLSTLETLNNFDEKMESSAFWSQFEKVKISNLGNFEGYSKYPNLINFVDASSVDFALALTYLKSLPKSQRPRLFTSLFGQQFQEKLRQWNIWNGRDNRFFSPYFAVQYNLEGISNSKPTLVNSYLEKGNFSASEDKRLKSLLSYENLAKYESEKVGLPIFNFASISKETALSLFGANSSKIAMDVFEEIINDNLDSLDSDKNYAFLAKFLPFSKGTQFYVKILKAAINKSTKKVTLTLNFDIKANGEFITSTAPIDIELEVNNISSWTQSEIISAYYKDGFATNSGEIISDSQNSESNNNAVESSANNASNNKKEGE